jgi:ubiquinone/menaquinone biosynthesis C-methylase UbiE
MRKPDYGLGVPWGKLRHRDRLLERVAWRGDEDVLDVGTGRGLLAIGAARRLKTGRAVGVDIFSGRGKPGSPADALLQNAEIEGVAERVDVRNADARHLPFPDASFDVVLSSGGLHTIGDADGREEACLEIARVLKPGGLALVSDYRHTREYEQTFRAAGLETGRSGLRFLDVFPPLRVVRAEKAGRTRPQDPRPARKR